MESSMSSVATASDLVYLASVPDQIAAELRRIAGGALSVRDAAPSVVAVALVREQVITPGMKQLVDDLLSIDPEGISAERLAYVRDMAPKVLTVLGATPAVGALRIAAAASTAAASASGRRRG
jgi:hypothetical protein